MVRLLDRIRHWEYLALCLLVLLSLALHLATVYRPSQLMVDEQYYVPDARSIVSDRTDLRLEHPPLGKLFIVAGIGIFGDNQMGWRFPSILFSLVSLILFYLICRKLELSRPAANLATFFLAFENMWFVQGGIAMLDAFFVAFMLFGFLLYLHRDYLSSGTSIAISALCKVYAAFALPAICIHWLTARRRNTWQFLLMLAVAATGFVAFFVVLDFAITGHMENPVARIRNMMSLSGSLTFANTTHPALSRPWQWVAGYKAMAYWYTPHYTSAISPTVWIAIIPIAGFLVYKAVRREEAGLFGFAWLAGTYLLLIPASILTNRISFVYYFYPTLGAICLGLGMAFMWLWELCARLKPGGATALRGGLIVFLGLHVTAFLLLSPLTAWMNYHVAG